MKQLFTLLTLFFSFVLWADLPYTPIHILVTAHKQVVLEGEKIGFTIKVYNSDKNMTIPVLHPAQQTTGRKLVYFNLYKHQNVNGMWIETEDRRMTNAMVHDVPHYPEIVYLKPLDTISFDVFFNSTFMNTEGHHSFNTPLFAGYYKFQAFYNPFDTGTGDTLYNRIDDFHHTDFQAGKANFYVSGEVYYPVNITILKNPASSFVIGNTSYFCVKNGGNLYSYYDENKVLVEQRNVNPELIPASSSSAGDTKPFFQVNLFPNDLKCSENCGICYAIKHREDDYLEVEIKKFVRKNRNSKTGLEDLRKYLLSHHDIAFVSFAGNMLSSLPSSAYLYIGLNSGYDIRTFGLGIQVGKVGKIPYYSFKNKCLAKSSKVDYMKMRHFQFDLRPVELSLKTDRDNLENMKSNPGKLPEIWPTTEYIFALSNSRPELGVCSIEEIKSVPFHQPDRFKKEYLESTDPISWCFAAAAGSIADRTEALRLIREKNALVALPYLYKCAEILANYKITNVRDGYSEELFLLELKKTIEYHTSSPVYLKEDKKYTVQDYLKEGVKQWNTNFYSISNLSDGTYAVEIREESAVLK